MNRSNCLQGGFSRTLVSQRGSLLTEMAVVIPLLWLFSAGLLDLAFRVEAQQSLGRVARELALQISRSPSYRDALEHAADDPAYLRRVLQRHLLFQQGALLQQYPDARIRITVFERSGTTLIPVAQELSTCATQRCSTPEARLPLDQLAMNLAFLGADRKTVLLVEVAAPHRITLFSVGRGQQIISTQLG